MKFKAICTDIDGTLLDVNRQLSVATLAAFKNIPNEVPVILASSRMPGAMRHLQAELGILHHPLVCFNGGYVIHYSNGNTTPEVLSSTIIPISACKEIIELALGTDIHVSLYHNDNWYAPAYDRWTEREARITKVSANIVDLSVIIKQWSDGQLGAHKVMCMGPEEEIERMEQQLKKKYSEIIHIYRSRPTYLELAPKAISKATGLQLILNRFYKFSIADVIAFGDNDNDIEMLDQAGWGVAVSNAKDGVKAVANEITSDSKADGVAMVLNKYFK